MGEHINIKGQSVKLGTCEDLYYATYDQVRAAASIATQQPGNAEPRDYLKPNIWRYRFPFPDEDGTAIGTRSNYDRGYLLKASHEFVRGFADHGDASVITPSPIYTRLQFPCPFTSAGVHAGVKVDQATVELIQQKLIINDEGNKQLWAVVRCPYCGTTVRLGEEEATTLAAFQVRVGNPDLDEVLNRMLAGYTRTDF